VSRLAAIRHRPFDANPERPAFPGLTDLFAERLAAYGVPVDHDGPLIGNRNSYARMSAQLLPELTVGAGPDLVVLAHCLPDCDLSTSVAGYLEQQIGTQPLVFAVTEQGRTTPFAALRVAQDLLRAGGHERIAVLVLDQETLVYADPALDGIDRDTDHAVGLLLTGDAPIRIGPVLQFTGVDVDRVVGALEAELDRLRLPGDTTLIAGAAVPAVRHPYRRRTAAPQRMCTGVWVELAAELSGPAGAGPRTVLATEYEPDLGYLSLAVFEVPPDEGAAR
jgi:hypothetical protein